MTHLRILLVEDENEFAGAVRGTLEREKFVVDHVDRIALAREACRSNTYDLVLLDRTLPDGDGLSLVPALRAALPGLAIIIADRPWRTGRPRHRAGRRCGRLSDMNRQSVLTDEVTLPSLQSSSERQWQNRSTVSNSRTEGHLDVLPALEGRDSYS